AAQRARLGGRRPPRGRRCALRDRAAGRPCRAGGRGVSTKRILVIEHNPDLAYGLRNNLEIEGYDVEVAGDGTKGLARARTGKPDLVMLDLMLPGLDGFRVRLTLREGGHGTPARIRTP